jgi:small-conductance mechanosensitive channel
LAPQRNAIVVDLDWDVLRRWVLDGVAWWDPHAGLVLGLQAAVLTAALGIAWWARRLLLPWTDRLVERLDPRLRQPRVIAGLRRLLLPLLWLVLAALASGVLRRAGWSVELARLTVNLLVAWILIRTVSLLVRDPAMARLTAALVWTLAALDLLDLLDPTIALLDGIAITLGRLRLSLFTLAKGAVVLGLLLWAALTAARFLDLKLRGVDSLTPSVQVLIGKLVKLGLITLAVLIGLTSIGIDVTALAVFGGAIGVGIGFGLQKVVSNLISGLILLLDKSIKPGDVIQLDETFGWITSLGARYVSVRSRDGREYLIPNEDLITHRVINWSYTSRQVRLEIDVPVPYGSDLHAVRRLLLAAAAKPDRVLKQPAPVCNLRGFFDGAVHLQLRFWIDDPKSGVANVRSDVFFAVWETLTANGIEIPLPQQEIRLKRPPARIADGRQAAD